MNTDKTYLPRIKEQILEGSPLEAYLEPRAKTVEGMLCRTEARNREALIEAMGKALRAVSGHAARGFFAHCGYRLLVQYP